MLNGMTVGGTGATSGGAVGGTINLITKHAPDVDITRLTGTYVSKSQFGENIDVSRRYGERKEWGVRLNSTYSNGNTPWNRQNDEFGNAVLGLDYRGENARFEADIGYQADVSQAAIAFLLSRFSHSSAAAEGRALIFRCRGPITNRPTSSRPCAVRWTSRTG